MEPSEKYYKLLGITPESSLQEINQAYVHALTQLHPDRLSDEPRRQKSAQARIREINEAYVAIKKLHRSPGNPSDSSEELAEAAFLPVASTSPTPRQRSGRSGSRKPLSRLFLLVLLVVSLAAATLRLSDWTPLPRHTPPPAPSAPTAPNITMPPPPGGPEVKSPSPDVQPMGEPTTSRQAASRVPAPRKRPPAAHWTKPPVLRQQKSAGQTEELSATQTASIKEAAEGGDAAAQTRLATLYMTGAGVRQNYGEAATWYRKAAEREYAPAQVWLGYLSAAGKGTRQDLEEAATWYRRAAKQKDVTAQVWLGYLYATGKGVPQDFGEAVTWYRRAAEQGHATAQVWLGYLYETGKGVPQDFGEALMWYYKAAQRGDATAREHLARLSKGANRTARPS